MLPTELRRAPWRDRSGRVSLLKAATLAALLYPAAWMLWEWRRGAWLIPQVSLIYWSGVWAIVVLLLALFVTPLRRIFRWRRLILVRRMIGVAALLYTLAHMVAWFWLRFWDVGAILTETVTRLTLIVATVSFVGLLALALTSFDAAIRRMGAAAWDRLHRWTYVFTGLAVLHFVLSPGAMAGRPFLALGLYLWPMGWRLLDRQGRGESVPALLGLGLATTALTVAAEVIWPALVFGMDPLFLLGANLSLILGLSPGWVMLAVTMSIALGAAWSQRLASATDAS